MGLKDAVANNIGLQTVTGLSTRSPVSYRVIFDLEFDFNRMLTLEIKLTIDHNTL